MNPADLAQLKELVELANKCSPMPWAVDPDDRPDMEWNNHIVQAAYPHMRVCFMAHAGRDRDNSALENSAKFIAAASKAIPALRALLAEHAIPEGWMQDRKQVTELAEHLENVAWQPDSHGDPDCVDQGSAMAAEVIRKVLLPMLAAAKETK
jgi:hypothetical protein